MLGFRASVWSMALEKEEKAPNVASSLCQSRHRDEVLADVIGSIPRREREREREDVLNFVPNESE